jgi:membrane protein implicated in regulation of membrane protease activity
MSDTSGKYTIPWLNVIILIAASIFALIAGEWTGAVVGFSLASLIAIGITVFRSREDHSGKR